MRPLKEERNMAVQHPTLDPLIGVWHSRGQVLDEDGATVVATIEGTDTYEWLGPTVVHRADVMMGDRHTRSLEVIEAYDADLGAFPMRAYDDEGGVDDSTATVDDEGCGPSAPQALTPRCASRTTVRPWKAGG